MPLLGPYQFFPSTALILTLLQSLHLASSQNSTASSLPYYNFTYPTFPDHYGSGIQVSYKDTIDVSWVANGVQHSPELQIRCWERNDSNSFIYYENPSSYSHDITASPSPSLDSYPLALAPYKQYSPCQLLLQDPHQSGETVVSVGIFISDKTNSSTMGVDWSADDPAPKVAVDAGVAIAKSESARVDHNGMGMSIWAFVGAAAAAAVLF